MGRHNEGRGKFSHLRARFCHWKNIEWRGMLDIIGHGMSKSYMSKSYYLRHKALHDLPKFASKTQRIQVGNGQYVRVLFVIPVIIEICGHR